MAAVTRSSGQTRVMHVVYALRPGGMELGVVKIVNGLDPQHIDSAVCSTRPAGDLKYALAPHVALHEFNGRNGNDLKLVWELYRLFAAERPHVVHTHGWGTLLEGLVAARFARVPVVIHGEHGTLQLRPYQRRLQRAAWSAVDQVLSVSSRLADRIAKETSFPRDSIRVLRNGVDLSRFGTGDRAAARAALGLSERTRVAVIVGRLVPVKDHLSLFEAVGMMRRSNVAVTLLVAGDGPLKESLEWHAARLGIRECVRFLGHTLDVERVFAAADVFVLSSESEGMSNTILEAMASGLPVVATDVGGADEMVIEGVTGLLVPARAPAELARALTALLTDQRRAQAMGAAGRARTEQEFSLDGMIERYAALYRQAVDAKTRQHSTSTVTHQTSERTKVI